MARATVRQPHGLVLAFAHASLGLAYLSAQLSNERSIPATSSDTLPTEIINKRDDTSSFAPAWEAGGGVAYRRSERWSLVAETQLFKAHHNMMIASEIQGVSQAKPLVTPFQSIQSVSVRVGAVWHFF